MSSPYGSHFDGSSWPWVLWFSDGWGALRDGNLRYVSDACVEGDEEQWREAAHALRGRHDYDVKRLAIRFVDKEIQFWSPRNSMGGYASLDVELADALADVIDESLRRAGQP